jgi:hypothetical protein
MNASEYRKQWNDDAESRQEWDKIIRSDLWARVSRMIYLEAVEASTRNGRMDHDAILARESCRMAGAVQTLHNLANAARPPAAKVQEPMPWESYGKSLSEIQPPTT